MHYRWVILLLAAAAMVGTLPGRTQGLGLVTEPLIADLQLGRVQVRGAQFVGNADRIAVFADRRRPLARFASAPASCSPPWFAGLGLVVCAMSRREFLLVAGNPPSR